MTYKKRMIRMVATVIVGWITVISTAVGVGILDKFDIIPSHGAFYLITGIMFAGTITLLVGMIGGCVVYVEHKLD